MSVKGKVLAAAATLTLVGTGAAGLATSGVAHAATNSCSTACVDIFSDKFGDAATGHSGFLMDSYKQGIAVGTPIILFTESNVDPAEDFVFENQGTVTDFNLAGLISNTTELHYGNLEAYEVEYAPFGMPSGNCVGVAATPTQGEKVTLQPCGISSKTIWIVDLNDGVSATHPFGNGAPLINGANVNFSHPSVLTYPSSGYPTDRPRPVLTTNYLTGFFEGVFPNSSTATLDVSAEQMWDADFGAIQF